MKKIWCDLCKKQIGSNIAFTMTHYGNPGWDNFHVTPRNEMDICVDCENTLRQAVNDAIKKIKDNVDDEKV